ncbi:MAG: bifunctional DNA-formamidopyrimidine glycosylase/DNA-(apurinic or apyrimidinic site) lyase [Candidatus Margulisiibacteriota bacterium]
MPELPEVETVRQDILPHLKGKTIKAVAIKDVRVIKGISASSFKRSVIGERIEDIERRAKYLLFRMRSGKYMMVHLGMTGRLLLSPDKYVKVSLKLSGNKMLYYSDLRLFGKLKFFNNYPELMLGPEPLSKEFSFDVLKEILKGRKAPIRSILLDQKLIAGLGNIYVLESLFNSGIDPRRPAKSLKDHEIKKLHKEIKAVLIKALGHRGTSFSWYRDAKGKKGGFQLKLNVYGKKGEPCPRCKTPIKRISIGNRGTYFCPKCQK